MIVVRLSWNMGDDGVATIYATDPEDRVFDLCDVWRRPAVERGGMTADEAREFQVFAAERICSAWNSDMAAAQVAEEHKIDPKLGKDGRLTDWGEGHNAACNQIANEIRRRFKF